VLSAVGLVSAERRRDAVRSVLRSGADLSAAAIAADVAALAAQARAGLGAEAGVRVRYDLRYRGQAFELSVTGAERPAPEELRAAFEDEHEARYGYRDPAAEIELVTVTVTAALPGAPIDAAAETGPPGDRSRRPAVFAGETVEATVLTGAPSPAEPLHGPAICELGHATLVVPPGWLAETGAGGAVTLRRSR
jgi:N-methylhydantoinase A/oxoprolinase/acetone carboxylase beta subunit